MIYAILAYHPEGVIQALTPDEGSALMSSLLEVHDRINETSSMGPAARLDFPTSAVTLRNGDVMDGPFAETKEQLLGFYAVECASLEAAIDAARQLQRVNRTAVYEIRPIALYLPGEPVQGG
jgi:hypothetical protein